uniref:Uncharacterized protein n=1 Tax=Chromera velia CCMP2878 TaxID=1169474 RepID=A0A0G4GSF7_9ALVE|eukprot:Cvel_5146.t1-p1 / transcript=Cvel_5146.t1 / gene=Cvel_5146 / organism=Chromera_velia_CCMP2878 / gene_product=hypothetical protein / transcript_product=hypothetical protein / location=Cvel_scaffold235:90338-97300(-) / protein_length=1316 / sequence_SO=supercontig / SO=protein_coding / is_pseudo=false
MGIRRNSVCHGLQPRSCVKLQLLNGVDMNAEYSLETPESWTEETVKLHNEMMKARGKDLQQCVKIFDAVARHGRSFSLQRSFGLLVLLQRIEELLPPPPDSLSDGGAAEDEARIVTAFPQVCHVVWFQAATESAARVLDRSLCLVCSVLRLFLEGRRRENQKLGASCGGVTGNGTERGGAGNVGILREERVAGDAVVRPGESAEVGGVSEKRSEKEEENFGESLTVTAAMVNSVLQAVEALELEKDDPSRGGSGGEIVSELLCLCADAFEVIFSSKCDDEGQVEGEEEEEGGDSPALQGEEEETRDVDAHLDEHFESGGDLTRPLFHRKKQKTSRLSDMIFAALLLARAGRLERAQKRGDAAGGGEIGGEVEGDFLPVSEDGGWERRKEPLDEPTTSGRVKGESRGMGEEGKARDLGGDRVGPFPQRNVRVSAVSLEESDGSSERMHTGIQGDVGKARDLGGGRIGPFPQRRQRRASSEGSGLGEVKRVTQEGKRKSFSESIVREEGRKQGMELKERMQGLGRVQAGREKIEASSFVDLFCCRIESAAEDLKGTDLAMIWQVVASCFSSGAFAGGAEGVVRETGVGSVSESVGLQVALAAERATARRLEMETRGDCGKNRQKKRWRLENHHISQIAWALGRFRQGGCCSSRLSFPSSPSCSSSSSDLLRRLLWLAGKRLSVPPAEKSENVNETEFALGHGGGSVNGSVNRTDNKSWGAVSETKKGNRGAWEKIGGGGDRNCSEVPASSVKVEERVRKIREKRFSLICLANLLGAAARLNVVDMGEVSSLVCLETRRRPEMAQRADFATVAQLLWALGSLRVADPMLVSRLVRRAEEILSALSPEESVQINGTHEGIHAKGREGDTGEERAQQRPAEGKERGRNSLPTVPSLGSLSSFLKGLDLLGVQEGHPAAVAAVRQSEKFLIPRPDWVSNATEQSGSQRNEWIGQRIRQRPLPLVLEQKERRVESEDGRLEVLLESLPHSSCEHHARDRGRFSSFSSSSTLHADGGGVNRGRSGDGEGPLVWADFLVPSSLLSALSYSSLDVLLKQNTAVKEEKESFVSSPTQDRKEGGELADILSIDGCTKAKGAQEEWEGHARKRSDCTDGLEDEEESLQGGRKFVRVRVGVDYDERQWGEWNERASWSDVGRLADFFETAAHLGALTAPLERRVISMFASRVKLCVDSTLDSSEAGEGKGGKGDRSRNEIILQTRRAKRALMQDALQGIPSVLGALEPLISGHSENSMEKEKEKETRDDTFMETGNEASSPPEAVQRAEVETQQRLSECTILLHRCFSLLAVAVHFSCEDPGARSSKRTE